METYELVPYLYLGMKDRDIAIQPSAWQVFMIDFICSFSCRVLSLFWAEYSAVPFVIKFYKIDFSNAIFICTFSYFNVDHPCGWLTRTCMHTLEQGVNTLAIDSQLGGSTGRPEGKIKREKDSCHSVICNIMVESSYHMRPYLGDEHINMWQMSIYMFMQLNSISQLILTSNDPFIYHPIFVKQLQANNITQNKAYKHSVPFLGKVTLSVLH